MPTITPAYWDEACRHLSKRDRVMKKLIPKFGEARLQSRGDAFTTLARSIVGQQISVKAAQSVWDRFAAAVGGPSHRLAPDAVLALDTPTLRGAGLSARKAEYLGDFSGEPVSRAEAREVGEAWAPYRSVATWYIWRSLDPLPVDY
jgi:DNA-3-methyladenine glycosylase II